MPAAVQAVAASLQATGLSGTAARLRTNNEASDRIVISSSQPELGLGLGQLYFVSQFLREHTNRSCFLHATHPHIRPHTTKLTTKHTGHTQTHTRTLRRGARPNLFFLSIYAFRRVARCVCYAPDTNAAMPASQRPRTQMDDVRTRPTRSTLMPFQSGLGSRSASVAGCALLAACVDAFVA